MPSYLPVDQQDVQQDGRVVPGPNPQVHNPPPQYPPRAAVLNAPVAQPQLALTPAVDAQLQLRELSARGLHANNVSLDYAKTFSEAGNLLSRNLCAMILTSIFLIVMMAVLLWSSLSIAWAISPIKMHEPDDESVDPYPEAVDPSQGYGSNFDDRGYDMDSWIQFRLWYGVFSFLTSVFIILPFYLGFFHAVCLAMRNNGQYRFGDMVSYVCSSRYCKAVGFCAIYTIAVTIGYNLLWIPGVYFQIITCFSLIIFSEYPDIPISQMIRQSAEIVHRKFCQIFGFLFICGLIQLLGLLCFGIGIFITMPLALIATAMLYHQIVGVKQVAPFEWDQSRNGGVVLQHQAQAVGRYPQLHHHLQGGAGGPTVAIPMNHIQQQQQQGAHQYPAQGFRVGGEAVTMTPDGRTTIIRQTQNPTAPPAHTASYPMPQPHPQTQLRPYQDIPV